MSWGLRSSSELHVWASEHYLVEYFTEWNLKASLGSSILTPPLYEQTKHANTWSCVRKGRPSNE
jgi:hypothetical protein